MSARQRKTQFATLHARRRKVPAVEEITYDPEARQEYLTGFHKRKVQRQQYAQEIAAKKEREEKLRGRQRLRDERKARITAHVDAVNVELRKQAAIIEGRDEDGNGDGSEIDSDIEASDTTQQDAVDHEDEYLDDDKFTTVTVEMVDVTRDGMAKSAEERPSDEAEGVRRDQSGRRREAAVKDSNGDRHEDKLKKPKKKKKKFRYESKAERLVARAKVKVRNDKAKTKRLESR